MGNRVMLCDDDVLVRSVVRRLMQDSGYEVVAETDSPDDALAAMGQGGVDLVILDLALRAGNGEHLLARLHEGHPEAEIIVFSAYVADTNGLIEAGAVAVVEKPHFERLETVSRQLLARSDESMIDRRRPSSQVIVSLPAPTGRTLSGLEPWASFTTAAASLDEGDAILALDLLPKATMREVWDDVYRLDYRVAVARAVVASCRPHDRVSFAPEGLPVMFVVAGRAEAPTAVFERLERHWRREIDVGYLVGAYVFVGSSPDAVQLLRDVVAGVHREGDHVERPLRMV